MDEIDALAWANRALAVATRDGQRLVKIDQYLHGKQPHPAVPPGTPQELRALASIARVNVTRIVVNSVAQTLYVDGYRRARAAEDAEPWRIWQVNQMDARQTAVHRAALAYGAAFVLVVPPAPGELPRIRVYSPLRATVLYANVDDLWPAVAMFRETPITDRIVETVDYRLVTPTETWMIRGTGINGGENLAVMGPPVPHMAGVVPVVRFLNTIDADGRIEGEVEQLFELQNQVDLTTFALLVAQHYGAFRQRAIIGWVADSEEMALKASAQRLWQFEDPDVKLFEFGQTDLGGYLESREASLRHAASLSQTPVHELLGSLVNLSAEALVAAEAGYRRKVAEKQIIFGEAWEQTLEIAGAMAGLPIDPTSEVRWRDTESRALSATVDALGKMAQMLGIPPQELWDRIPGVTQQDVERWRVAYENGNALAMFQNELRSQVADLLGDG
jgi:hypothetical protein